jgi:hypothetical protein
MKAFETVFASFPDLHWGTPKPLVQGDRGFTEYFFAGTKAMVQRLNCTAAIYLH